jgi:hypothetical protein
MINIYIIVSNLFYIMISLELLKLRIVVSLWIINIVKNMLVFGNMIFLGLIFILFKFDSSKILEFLLEYYYNILPQHSNENINLINFFVNKYIISFV